MGLPGGKAVIIPDYVCIAKTSAHPKEAYEFAKFMSFGRDGIIAKLDAVEQNEGVTWTAIPLIVDDEISQRFFANFPIEGVQEVYENLGDNGVVEAFKFTPGYSNARWNGLTGIAITGNDNANMWAVINACMVGELNIDDYADQLNTLGNQFIKEVADIIASKVA